MRWRSTPYFETRSSGFRIEPVATRDTAPFVGRGVELERLRSLLAAALAGKRQIVFASGEPGIGKTTLAERFLNAALSRHELRFGRGQ